MALFGKNKKLERLQKTNSVLVRANNALRGLVSSYTNNADITADMLENFKWSDPATLGFNDYLNIYKNNPVAEGVIHALTRNAWKRKPQLVTDSPVGETLVELMEGWKAFSSFEKADKDALIGQYSVIVLGLPGESSIPAQRAPVIEWVREYSQKDVEIVSYIKDINSPMFGMPEYYQITIKVGDQNMIRKYHWSRVIHVSRGDGPKAEYYMRNIFNQTKDVLKSAGAASEALFRAACYILTADIDKDSPLLTEASSYDMFDDVKSDNGDLVKVLLNSMKGAHGRGTGVLVGQGAKFNNLKAQQVNPGSVFDTILSMISFKTGVPKRMMIGNEAGHLASSQDRSMLNDTISQRHELFIIPQILDLFTNRLIELGFVKEFDYEWQFDVLSEPTDEEVAAAEKTRASTLETLIKAMMLGGGTVIDESKLKELFPNVFREE